MEKKNTILLTVIAVATLLVAVVGATFAYFTATTTGENNGTAKTTTATNTGSVKLTYGDVGVAGDIKYPGAKYVQYGTVTPTVEGAGTFSATYKVKATVDASALKSTNTVIKATLYKSDTALTGDLTTGCTMKTGTAANTEDGKTVTTYYYDENCKFSDSLVGATKVAEKELNLSTATDKVIDLESTEQSFSGLTSATTGVQPYYYVAVDYVNNASADQNADMGQSIQVQIVGVVDARSVAAAQ